jgi:hypothetical protein
MQACRVTTLRGEAVMIVVRSANNVWIGYGAWWVWRWLTKFPEDAEFRDNPDVQARIAA